MRLQWLGELVYDAQVHLVTTQSMASLSRSAQLDHARETALESLRQVVHDWLLDNAHARAA